MKNFAFNLRLTGGVEWLNVRHFAPAASAGI
jgi:hypothetical protein